MISATGLTVPAEIASPAYPRSPRDAYYDRRFEYYRTMGGDYSTAADWAAADRDRRYPTR